MHPQTRGDKGLWPQPGRESAGKQAANQYSFIDLNQAWKSFLSAASLIPLAVMWLLRVTHAHSAVMDTLLFTLFPISEVCCNSWVRLRLLNRFKLSLKRTKGLNAKFVPQNWCLVSSLIKLTAAIYGQRLINWSKKSFELPLCCSSLPPTTRAASAHF